MKVNTPFAKARTTLHLAATALSCLIITLATHRATAQQATYCNPVDLDYTYMVVNSHKNISYRSGADPAVVGFRGAYYMFVTRSMGYWHSKDMTEWEFVDPEKWYFQGSNAPAAFNYKDSVLYVTGDPSGIMSLLYTDNPKKGDWKAVPAILWNLQDPAFFIDDDGRSFIFWGSSNVHPIRGYELDTRQRFIPKGETVEFFTLEEDKHGWERFGENHNHPTLDGYMEGAWLTKHKGTYYMQYAAPGTEWDTYADGVYTSDDPLGPYTYAPNNPISYKPGGFINGAGHGSTAEGPGGQYWHFGTMAISVNYKFERRVGQFPAFFDADGLMHVNTAYGDYPHYAPSDPDRQGAFTGWMLLSYNKPVTASSTRGDFAPPHVNDEDVQSVWVPEADDEAPWVEIDLGEKSTIRAVQVNYNDYESDIYGRQDSLYHQYVIEASLDGQTWRALVDKSDNYEDVPNDYTELSQPAEARMIRFRSLHVPTQNLAVSGLRIFGKGAGKTPAMVKGFGADRDRDRRNVTLSWNKVKGAQGYNVRWGIAEDKLYNAYLVYDKNDLELRSLNTDQEYYFTVEAFNENGVGKASKMIHTD
ncbi:family 43 glycosylhydrolase [Roseivirga sp. BDSF3-8]|uniref:family 43 glycosylhydrolase n=1 Tax=Roseivirga sp. BDSF3-8 TaxID=3241598 RepID=UPI00353264D0